MLWYSLVPSSPSSLLPSFLSHLSLLFLAKIIKKDKHSKRLSLDSDDMRHCLMQEIDILKRYGNRHPNIVSLVDVFEDRKKIVLLFEL